MARTVTIVAHRGNSAECPENTLAAFRSALDLGADVLEFDVQTCADGHMVVMHDPTVDRTTNGRGRVADLALGDLRLLDAGNWFAPQFTAERIPLLDEVLDMVPPQVGLNIHLKWFGEGTEPACEDFDRAVLDTVIQRGLLDRSLLVTRLPEQIQRLRGWEPLVECALLPGPDLAHYIEETLALGLHVTQPRRSMMSAEWVGRLHAARLVGNVFYADTDEDMRTYIGYGIDGILTNEPGRLRRLLSAEFPDRLRRGR